MADPRMADDSSGEDDIQFMKDVSIPPSSKIARREKAQLDEDTTSFDSGAEALLDEDANSCGIDTDVAILPEGFSLKLAQKEHLSILLTSFQSMKVNNILTDFTVECRGGEELRAHRLILISASPYFRNSIDSTIDTAKCNTIDVNEMKVVLSFIYTGQIVSKDAINKNPSRLKRLLLAAHTLKVSALMNWCLHQLSQTLSFTNYEELLELAIKCNNEGLISRIYTFLTQNFAQLVSSKNIQRLEGQQLKRILQHPKLVQISQDTLLMVGLEWVEGSGTRKDHLLGLVQLIDLSRLTKEFLSKLLLSSSLIKDDHQVLAIIAAEAAKHMTHPLDPRHGAPSRGHQLISFGRDAKSKIVNIYDVEAHEWVQPAKIPPFDIGQGRCTVGFGKLVYIFGGLDCDAKSSSSIIKYSPYTNESVFLKENLRVPVNSAGGVVCNDAIYIINGVPVGANSQKTVQRYEPRDNLCCLVSPTNEPHKLPQAFSSGICLYVMGSNDDCVERYDTISDQWTKATRISGPLRYADRTAALCGTKLFINIGSDLTHFKIWNLKSREWMEKGFQGVGPILRMWSATSGENKLFWPGPPGTPFMLTMSRQVIGQQSQNQPTIRGHGAIRALFEL